MNKWDTSTVYSNCLSCYQNKQVQRIMCALSGVSPYRLKNAVKSNEDFNNLKLNEIIKLEEITVKILNEQKEN